MRELRLCWNFTNIRVQSLEPDTGKTREIDMLGAKAYFKTLYNRTRYAVCGDMVQKIEALERAQLAYSDKQETFLEQHLSYLTTISPFSEYEYSQLNEGVSLAVILEGQAFSEKVQGADDAGKDARNAGKNAADGANASY